MRIIPIAAALVALMPAAAQNSFEVASVRINQLAQAVGERSTRESIEPGPGGLAMRNVSLRSAIRWAFGVRDFQISAPGWMDSERYDIAAKAPGAASNEQLRLMLRTLLTERFKLVLHRETKELALYALVVGKRGTRIEAAKAEGEGSMRIANGALEFRSMSMAEFAERLSARPFGVERPVVDRTGLQGAFDFTMKLAENDAELKHALELRELEQDSSMFAAPLQELGLRLEAHKGPIEMLVIDRADKVPAEN